MTDDPLFSLEKAASENEVAFDYIKSSDFRTVWVDGVYGGGTPRGLIHIAAYTERLAIPRRQVFEITQGGEQTGQLGAEVPDKQVSRGSVVRDLSVDLLMSVDVAEGLASWLLDKVKEMRDLETARGSKK